MHSPRSRSLSGFTLIELLVVIAIIGILSAVVLASLSLARTKGSDAALQSDIHTIQNQAEIYYATNNNYGAAIAGSVTGPASAPPTAGGTIFFLDSTINSAMKAAIKEAPPANSSDGSCAAGVSGGMYFATGGTGAGTQTATWAVEVALKSDKCSYWCADSRGRAYVPTSGGGSLGGGASAAALCPA